MSRSGPTPRRAPTTASSPTCSTDVSDVEALAAALSAIPGVVDHGLFPSSMVSEVIIGRDGDVEDR